MGAGSAGFSLCQMELPYETMYQRLISQRFHESSGRVGSNYIRAWSILRLRKTPFGFIFAATIDLTGSDFRYIVPPAVIARKKVWRFEYQQWQRKPEFGPYWFYVTHAEPLQ